MTSSSGSDTLSECFILVHFPTWGYAPTLVLYK